MKSINKFLTAFMAVGVLQGAAALIAPHDASAQTSATVGSLRGQIRDKATGDAAVGATVVATSPSLQGEQVVITEEGGQYFITSLPPGLYLLTVYYNDATFTRGNVFIQVGKEAVVNVTVDSGATAGRPKGEVIEIRGTAPIVDQGSTKTGTTIGEEYTRNIPTGRTFGGVVGSAAGAQGDFYGTSISGATSLENTYIVEGINTTDTAFGEISSNLPTEFLQETEVITGGYNAEYGRATGGIVNVVTKQGSNEYHGSVFGYFSPGSLVADAETIVREGASIDSQSKLDYSYDVGAELGGPVIKDKLWFHAGFNPSVTHNNTTRIVNQVVDRDGDGEPDPDPATDSPLLEEVSRSVLPTYRNTYFFTGKLSGAINQNNQYQISLFGNPQKAQRILTQLVRNPQIARLGDDEGAYDVSAKYTSKLNDGKTQLDVVGGFHRGFETQRPLNPASSAALVRYGFERSLFDFADLEGASSIAACDDEDPNDPYPMIRNCPVTQYRESGLGTLEERTNDRTSLIASLTQRVKLAGYHTFKLGLDGEFATYNSHKYLTGGEALTRSCNGSVVNGAFRCDATNQNPMALPGRWASQQYIKFQRDLTADERALLDDNDPTNDPMFGSGQVVCAGGGALCQRADALDADTSNRSISAFLQDSWQIRPNFTLNAGLRWEQQVGYVSSQLQNKTTSSVIPGAREAFPEQAYSLNDLFAPRVGFIYDPTKEGKSKIFGHWGRFYENIPMDLNVRLYGGEILSQTTLNQNRRAPTNGMFDPNCNVDHGTPDLQATIDSCSDQKLTAVLGEGVEIAAPSLRAQYSQELILGTEYEVMEDFKVGFNYIHRSMPTVIEDVLAPTGEYILVNPGQSFEGDAADFEARGAALMASSNPDDQALGELYQTRADMLRRVKTFDRPERLYDGFQITGVQRPTKRSLIQASYTFSKTRGNYPGLFSAETLQEDPNITTQYDLPALGSNRFGMLGHDRTHNIKVDAFYMWGLGAAGGLVTGVGLRALSGVPHSVLGADPVYGEDESYLLKRGAGERSPLTTQADIHLAYGYQLNKTTRVEVFGRVFNIFNSQDETDRDETYTFDAVVPIVGGDLEDLRHVKMNDENGVEQNTTPTVNKNFGKLNARRASRSVQFGARLTF